MGLEDQAKAKGEGEQEIFLKKKKKISNKVNSPSLPFLHQSYAYRVSVSMYA